MNRRRFLIALAPFLQLAIFIVARAADEVSAFRPVAVGKVAGADSVFAATTRYLLIYGDRTGETLFDLKRGAQHPLTENEGLVGRGAWKWKLVVGRTVQLQLRWANGPVSLYACPQFEGDGLKPLAPDWMRISPRANRLEVLLMNRYYRWELRSGRLTRDVPMAFFDGSIVASSTSPDVLVKAGDAGIDFVSIGSGRRVRHVALRAPKDFTAGQFAPGGSYAVCTANNGFGPPQRNLVVDTRTGRVLWKFALTDWRDSPPFSPDGKRLAVPQIKRHRWEIHDSKTGAILRTLPLVPGATTGAFAPDGNTLYSLANGILYRQRAR